MHRQEDEKRSSLPEKNQPRRVESHQGREKARAKQHASVTLAKPGLDCTRGKGRGGEISPSSFHILSVSILNFPRSAIPK